MYRHAALLVSIQFTDIADSPLAQIMASVLQYIQVFTYPFHSCYVKELLQFTVFVVLDKK